MYEWYIGYNMLYDDIDTYEWIVFLYIYDVQEHKRATNWDSIVEWLLAK